ncbi:MAG: helix-turn-helix transcriptional regulator [Bacilli bacterium]
MIDFVSVGKKIMLYRKKLNLTQDELASKLFVTRQNLSKWENGTGIPSIESLLELSKIFNTTIENLLCLDDELDIDMNNIFNGHDRIYIINSIINKKIEVDIPNVFYQMSPLERMMILRAIKDGKLICKKEELYPKLTPSELKYMERKKEL